MKKLVITLLAAVLASGAFAQYSFPDIPANHWAGDAVERISDLGIVIGFPDGTYRGNEAFTRYQAALVVARLLDVINDNVNAALALTQADVDSLRNAVQELASDVAAQGVRLSAAESAIAGLSDDAAVTAARLDDLEAGGGSGSGAVLRDLQNQIASQRVAIDTAQATADAAAARADEAYSLARQANSLSRENASDIANLNRVVGLIQRDVNALKSGGGVVEGSADLSGVNAAIERNRSDIANIREFVILLRRDQVALRDRVSALEASDAAQDAAIADLQSRVQALEENPLGINGNIAVRYYVGRIIDYRFDVDRVYGINNARNMGASVFSTGAAELSGPFVHWIGHPEYRTNIGERAQDRADIRQASGDDIFARLTLAFDYGFNFDGQGSPRGLNSFSGVLDVSLDTQRIDYNTVNPAPDFEDDPAQGRLLGNLFRVNEFMSTFEPIGAVPLTFSFGTNVRSTFTPYVLRTNDPGFVATITAPDFLAFLNPTLTAVYTSPAADTYLRGARVTLSPLDGLTVGGSFVQRAANAGDKDDYLADNDQITVWGVDGNLALSIFNLGFEWANGTGAATDESVLYARLGVDASGLPIIDSLSANYRSISPVWNANGYNLGAAASGYPFSQDQTGFGVNAGFNLFNLVSLTGYFDTYTVDAGNSVTAFGVDATANLFAGFSLGGWYHQAATDGNAVDNVRWNVDAAEAQVTAADLRRNSNNWNTGFGVSLRHNGAADNALIRGLNLSASYAQEEADFSRSTIAVNADYALNVSIVSLTPYVGFTLMNDSDAAATPGSAYAGLREIRAGTGLSTTALDIFLRPSLIGAVNYRSATYTEFGGATWDASELQWSVGLVLNEFIFENSTLTAKYGSWTGTNINNVTNSVGAGDTATDISGGDVNNGDTQTTSGYELIWNYWDLQFAYGVYVNNDARGGASAQAFSISYTVSF